MWTQPRSHNLKTFWTRCKLKKNTYLVQSACEIDDDFSGSVIVNDLKLTNVTWAAKKNKLWNQSAARCGTGHPDQNFCISIVHLSSSYSPCFIMTVRKRTITLEQGLIRTWRFPRFSALLMLLRASARTFMRTMMPAKQDTFSHPSIERNGPTRGHRSHEKRGKNPRFLRGKLIFKWWLKHTPDVTLTGYTANEEQPSR